MYVSIDVGGTKTLIASMNAHGEITEQVKFPTPKIYDEFIVELAKAIGELKTKDFRAGCIAMPGMIDRKHGVAISFGNLDWKNIPIQADLEKILNCPFLVENDANLAGLSEAHLVKDEYRKVLYITVSTGIGGIYVVDGVMDPNTIDAEVGHMLLEHGDELMRWQEFASGRAITKKFGKKASEITDPQAWYFIAHNIAVGLITLIASLTPEAIIIGGGVGTHLQKFQPQLEEILKIYENPMLKMPVILQAKRPEEAVVYGGYLLAKKHYGK